MNDATELKDRQTITKILIEDEMKSLQDGYNPIKEKYERVDKSIPTERTPFIMALDLPLAKLNAPGTTWIIWRVTLAISKKPCMHSELNTNP